MKETSRRKFVRNALAVTGGSLLIPQFLKGMHFKGGGSISLGKAVQPEELVDEFHSCAIFDLHCHPSMKMRLWGKKFWKKHLSVGRGDNLLPMQEDSRQFDYGYVRGIVATHYLLEGNMQREWRTLRFFFPVIKFFSPSTVDKIEHEDSTNTDQVIEMIDVLEQQLTFTNSLDNKYQYKIVKTFAEFADTAKIGSKTIPVAHAIEGAHALGRNLVFSINKTEEKRDFQKKNPAKPFPQEGKMQPAGPSNAEKYLENLNRLIERGVCMITLSHFYENDLSYPVEGISPKEKKLPGIKTEYNPATDDLGLKDVGIAVVTAMLNLGVVVDLTHSTPQVRRDVYKIRREVNATRMAAGKHCRPLAYSHVGSQEIFDLHDHGMYPNYKYYNVSQDEIRELSEQGGVMGVIPEIFWLAGSNRAPRIPGVEAPFDEETGIPYLIETMKALNKYTKDKNYDNIALGTDFDGLADNPKDLYVNKHLVKLFDAMNADAELSQGNRIKKITRLNALRLLQTGWGEADQTAVTNV